MKKFAVRLITLLLCACLLCGSAAAYTIIDVDEDLSFSQDLKEKEDVSDWAKAEIDAARAAEGEHSEDITVVAMRVVRS